jgi:hypothetical protein
MSRTYKDTPYEYRVFAKPKKHPRLMRDRFAACPYDCCTNESQRASARRREQVAWRKTEQVAW